MRETKEAKEMRGRVEARQRAEVRKKEVAFLIGLEKLSRKTGIVINTHEGAYLEEVDMLNEPECAGYGSTEYDDAVWITPADGSFWESYKHVIVKSEGEKS